jgi:SAM-dependent methyltransferase
VTGPAPRRPRRASTNFTTTDALAVRLDTLRRHYRREGPFGFDVLGADAADEACVLEIGPGDGRHAAAFLGRTGAEPASWTLLDASEAMAAAARTAFPPYVRVRAVVGDADRIPVAADARFELIVAMHVLAFLRRPRALLRAAAARLSRGGRLLVTTAAHDMAELRRPVRAVLREHGLPWGHVTSDYAAPRAERDLRALFRRVDVHPQRGAIEFPDAETAVRYVLTMPWLDDVPARVRKAAAARIRDDAERSLAASGVFRVRKEGVTFVASEPRG